MKNNTEKSIQNVIKKLGNIRLGSSKRMSVTVDFSSLNQFLKAVEELKQLSL